jgi:LysR family nitrogen assimilation transcriptional regulator
VSIELRQMRYFAAVVDHGQISSAARALHLAQPALSQSVAALERELGVATSPGKGG